MENSSFFLLFCQDTLDRLQQNSQCLHHVVHLKFHLTSSNPYQDHHATFPFHHKVTIVTSSGHIN